MRNPVSFSMEYFSLDSRRKTEEQLLSDLKARKLKATSWLAATVNLLSKAKVTSEICWRISNIIQSNSSYRDLNIELYLVVLSICYKILSFLKKIVCQSAESKPNIIEIKSVVRCCPDWYFWKESFELFLFGEIPDTWK